MGHLWVPDSVDPMAHQGLGWGPQKRVLPTRGASWKDEILPEQTK